MLHKRQKYTANAEIRELMYMKGVSQDKLCVMYGRSGKTMNLMLKNEMEPEVKEKIKSLLKSLPDVKPYKKLEVNDVKEKTDYAKMKARLDFRVHAEMVCKKKKIEEGIVDRENGHYYNDSYRKWCNYVPGGKFG